MIYTNLLATLREQFPKTLYGYLVLVFITLTTLMSLFLVTTGYVTSSYLGDEGLRIYDAYQTGLGYENSRFDGIWPHLTHQIHKVHPPGDILLRAVIIRLFGFFDISGSPVQTLIAISILAGVATHYFVASYASKASGNLAGIVALTTFAGSYLMNDIRLSSTAEALALPFVAAGLILLQKALQEKKRGTLLWAGACLLVSSFFRVETAFLLPFLCLVLWRYIGFWHAAIFGAISGAFEFYKIIHALFFNADNAINLLNVGNKYAASSKPLSWVIQTQFFETLTTDPSFVFFVFTVLASIYIIFFTTIPRNEKTSLILSASCLTAYTIVVIAAQLKGAAPHAGYRMASYGVLFTCITFGLCCGVFTKWLDNDTAKKKYLWLKHLSPSMIIVASISLFNTYQFLFIIPPKLHNKVPVSVIQSAEFALLNASKEDPILLDRIQFWGSAILPHFSDRKASACHYAQCIPGREKATEIWTEMNGTVPAHGRSRLYGAFNTLTMHAFIDIQRPRFIIIDSKDHFNKWQAVANRIWSDNADIFQSSVRSYIQDESTWDNASPAIAKFGEIDGQTYFETYARLTPVAHTPLTIILEVQYLTSLE